MSGNPAGPQEGSLRSKLIHIRVDETIYVDDVWSSGKATRMERAVQTAIRTYPELEGREFSTARWAGVRSGPAECKDLLGITRTA